jgi:hypothetical protein
MTVPKTVRIAGDPAPSDGIAERELFLYSRERAVARALWAGCRISPRRAHRGTGSQCSGLTIATVSGSRPEGRCSAQSAANVRGLGRVVRVAGAARTTRLLIVFLRALGCR